MHSDNHITPQQRQTQKRRGKPRLPTIYLTEQEQEALAALAKKHGSVTAAVRFLILNAEM